MTEKRDELKADAKFAVIKAEKLERLANVYRRAARGYTVANSEYLARSVIRDLVEDWL